ncbi:MAG: DEAD/DEAH box helicase [Deltaproteobacteria bacterium HGW-Deltaproteobacteria-14]|nr:MAG: DEAD/DEAH box helicase [Deltaproteobacteria bacterium HGW-Deltaproteobacteria-14]
MTAATPSPLDAFGPGTRAWFEAAFAAPTRVQRDGWPVIARGDDALLIAPTGSGKTLAAFLWCLDTIGRRPPDDAPGYRVVYISPLKALVYDVERNLRTPLAGIARTAQRLGVDHRAVRVDVRTGDTPPDARRRMARDPGDILVTTPESLYLLLGSAARENLVTVETLIIDEIHALAPTKRGAHLALSVARLAHDARARPQRIGLSATVRPAAEVARFLTGDGAATVVDAAEPPHIDVEIIVPLEDMARPSLQRQVEPRRSELVPQVDEVGRREPRRSQGLDRYDTVSQPDGPARSGATNGRETSLDVHARPSREDASGDLLGTLTPQERASVWPAIEPRILELVLAHRSTIVFVNSRGLAERLAGALNDRAGEPLVRAHHGSIAHAQRTIIEEQLKHGELRGIVATSSLELGIDMGAVDLVVQVESPDSAARGLQRIGRAGHNVGEISKGKVFPKHRGDLLEATVVARRMQLGLIEAITLPRNTLDVLAQQIVAMCAMQQWSLADLSRLVRSSYTFSGLTNDALHGVLDMLSGRYPSTELADLRPRLTWDRVANTLEARRGARFIALVNGGTIPDRGLYTVHVGPDGPRVGELDEEMVYESRPGDTFILGASTWRVQEITRDRVIVSPAPGQPGKMPFWHGDGPGRPLETGRAIGAFVREVGALTPAAAVKHLEAWPLDALARQNLVAYLTEQREATGTLPTDQAITVERFRDELGDWRVCLLTPFGARVHAPWALALESILTRRAGFEVQAMWSDDGVVLRFADSDEVPDYSQLALEPEEVEDLVIERLGSSALFAATFRESAARALLLPRRSAKGRAPLWQQRLRSSRLLAVAQRFPSFPIVLESYRQCLQDVFDLDALREILGQIRTREVRIEEVETASASPFARSLVFAFVAAFLYEGDAPLAERKALALALDRNLLRELLGQEQLRDLLDAAVIAEVEAELQRLVPERHASHPDAVHDLLRQLGALSEAELARRCDEPRAGALAGWLAALVQARRVVPLRVGGEARWAAVEDVGRYRDALGAMLPSGLPAAFLAAVERPLEGLMMRWARTHGPFVTEDPARWLGLPAEALQAVLEALVAAGRLLEGGFTPGRIGRESSRSGRRSWRVFSAAGTGSIRAGAAPGGSSRWWGSSRGWRCRSASSSGASCRRGCRAISRGCSTSWARRGWWCGSGAGRSGRRTARSRSTSASGRRRCCRSSGRTRRRARCTRRSWTTSRRAGRRFWSSSGCGPVVRRSRR